MYKKSYYKSKIINYQSDLDIYSSILLKIILAKVANNMTVLFITKTNFLFDKCKMMAIF